MQSPPRAATDSILPFGGRFAAKKHPLEYLDCPRCRARFLTGALYESFDYCRRCGAPLDSPRRSLRDRLRTLRRGRSIKEVPDWETITGSQYAVRAYLATTGTAIDSPPRAERRPPHRERAAEGSEPDGARSYVVPGRQ